eukprot:TRINITY_DN6634_c0_g1_i1.p1 TRINITY_DN6634_c0_g1~~TRINITY_DN6634_c0_g1_i1.p1  ORF type:complete len:209 (-),score=79.87 TRINITY_DN6634_c0_g1_i1:12-638(-)
MSENNKTSESNYQTAILQMSDRVSNLENKIDKKNESQIENKIRTSNLILNPKVNIENKDLGLNQRIANLTTSMKIIETQHESFVKFFTNMKQLDYSISNFETSLPKDALSKLVIVEASLPILQKTKKKFETIQNPEQITNPNYLQEIPTLEVKLKNLETLNLSEIAQIEEISEEQQILLKTYNEIISGISQKFVFWDNILELAELKFQ